MKPSRNTSSDSLPSWRCLPLKSLFPLWPIDGIFMVGSPSCPILNTFAFSCVTKSPHFQYDLGGSFQFPSLPKPTYPLKSEHIYLTSPFPIQTFRRLCTLMTSLSVSQGVPPQKKILVTLQTIIPSKPHDLEGVVSDRCLYYPCSMSCVKKSVLDCELKI